MQDAREISRILCNLLTSSYATLPSDGAVNRPIADDHYQVIFLTSTRGHVTPLHSSCYPPSVDVCLSVCIENKRILIILLNFMVYCMTVCLSIIMDEDHSACHFLCVMMGA